VEQVNTLPYSFKQLSEEDDVQSFHCGLQPWQTEVSDFLKDDALTQQLQGLNVTWLCYSGVCELRGYFSLTASSIQLPEGDELRVDSDLEQIGRNYFPCVLIAQFGVQSDAQGQGVGTNMLNWVGGLVVELDIGARFLTVHIERDNNRGLNFWGKKEFKRYNRRSEGDLIYMAYDLYSTPQ